MKNDSCKNRNDTAGKSIDIAWHVCLGDTSVQVVQHLQLFMSYTGHEPEHFPNRIIFASIFNDITNWKMSERATQMMKWLLRQQDSDRLFVFLWSRTGKDLAGQ